MNNLLLNNDEDKRLEAVHNLGIVDTAPEKRFDVLTEEASDKLHCPISTITIIDKDREWYKSKKGIKDQEEPREVSFCAHAMLAKNVFIIEDTLKDPRFAKNPMVTGFPHIRSYAGVALYDRKSGLPIDVLCVKDLKPRVFTLSDINVLLDIAGRAENEINK